MTKHVLLIWCVLCMCFPWSAEARHNDRWGRVDRSSLDDDPVEEMPVPVLFGIEYADIVSDFGDPRGDGTRAHEGQDMLAPKGTPIVSPTEAVVIRTGSGESSGKYVYTANPGGEVFRYMHLDTYADLDPGDKLKTGDFIGTVGDTGNASDGVYHLHLEIRDEDNDATDPYPRLTDTFSLKEKASFLEDIIDSFKRSDRDEYAEFLVETFPAEFRAALNADYDLPEEIVKALNARGIRSTAKLQEQLNDLVASIPKLLTRQLSEGDSGAAVTLLQLYLVYSSEGVARRALVGAGATGYYGSLTTAAIREYQAAHEVPVTGAYDATTRKAMLDAK